MESKLRKIEGIVIHRTEIALRSYHILVQKDGSKLRLVADDFEAPHALAFNKTTLAIAVFGDFASSEPGKNWTPTEAQYDATIDQCQQWIQAYGDIWIKGHSELGPKGTAFTSKLTVGHTCPGERFDLDRVRLACLMFQENEAQGPIEGGGSVRG